VPQPPPPGGGASGSAGGVGDGGGAVPWFERGSGAATVVLVEGLGRVNPYGGGASHPPPLSPACHHSYTRHCSTFAFSFALNATRVYLRALSCVS
jgi:hypothetical protein